MSEVNSSILLSKNPLVSEEESTFLRGCQSFTNSILLAPNLDEESIASMQVSHSIVHPGAEHFPGRGNIDADPLLDDDFRPLPNSPAIDAGTITHRTTDLAGNPRPVDIPGVGIEGPDAFDIGAYEFQLEDWPTPTEEPTATPTPGPMLSDIDGDELVNWADLFLLQQDWLKQMPKEASAEQVYKTDLNEDEWVDAFDLLILLNEWRQRP